MAPPTQRRLMHCAAFYSITHHAANVAICHCSGRDAGLGGRMGSQFPSIIPLSHFLLLFSVKSSHAKKNQPKCKHAISSYLKWAKLACSNVLCLVYPSTADSWMFLLQYMEVFRTFFSRWAYFLVGQQDIMHKCKHREVYTHRHTLAQMMVHGGASYCMVVPRH